MTTNGDWYLKTDVADCDEVVLRMSSYPHYRSLEIDNRSLDASIIPNRIKTRGMIGSAITAQQ